MYRDIFTERVSERGRGGRSKFPMIFSENTWLIVWTSNPIEFLEFSQWFRPRISRRPLFHDSGSKRGTHTTMRCCFASKSHRWGVLIDGFRYVEFEWAVIKRGKGKGGRKKKKCVRIPLLSFQVRSDANYRGREKETERGRDGWGEREERTHTETPWNRLSLSGSVLIGARPLGRIRGACNNRRVVARGGWRA